MSNIASLCKFKFLSLELGMQLAHSLTKGIKTPKLKIVTASKKFC